MTVRDAPRHFTWASDASGVPGQDGGLSGRNSTVFWVCAEHVAGTSVAISSDGQDLHLEGYLDGSRLLTVSRLGIEANGEALGPGSTLSCVSREQISESYHAHVGKATGHHSVQHEQVTLALRSPLGREWSLIVRVAADGFAFRYRLWPQGVSEVELGKELTTLQLDAKGRLWTLDYHTWYETIRFGTATKALEPGDYGLPTLAQAGDDNWVLLAESDIDGNSSGAHLVRDAGQPAGALRVAADEVPLAVPPGHLTPWRVAITGPLDRIVASNLVDDLATPADPAVPVVARPGRAAWSWWTDHNSGSSLEKQKALVDYAARQGWEYITVDYGWEPTWIPELVAYASCRGVQVHVWSLWSDLNGPANLRKLALWRSWGIVGVKVDCMESESRDRYRWYDSVMAEAERVGLMLNFHGSVIPRGWTRTHPNVVSYEAVRGAEAYIYHGEPLSAAHNLIQVFTRNIVGPMDFTPVTFSAPGRETSEGHELALAVEFESGITHFADDLDEYDARPPAVRLMSTLPPVWHEVRLLEGHPDSHAVIARRRGRTWFVAGLSNGAPRTVSFDPTALLDDYVGWLVEDSPSGGLAERAFTSRDGAIAVAMAQDGGFVAVLGPSAEAIAPAVGHPTRKAVIIEPDCALVEQGDEVLLEVDPEADLVTATGWTAEPAG
ncbi:MAG: glycoside hydrolase family 97 protein, partial [Propionibacteriaceae bacterium]|nr:glycoside hydrolase family 97 protein [Propionibacteriaceae bacterium]